MAVNFDFFSNVFDNLRDDNTRRRREDAREITFLEEAEANNEIDEGNEHQRVTSVDMKARTNALKCNCEKFELVERKDGRSVIIRRGATLTLDVTLNSEPDLKSSQKLGLTFSFGRSANVPNGTQAKLNVTKKKTFGDDTTLWDVRLVTQAKNTLTLEVHVPVHVMVGIWQLTIEVSPQSDPSAKHVFQPEETLYILFNPWNKDDDVYMEEDELRDEYILNDVGKIWRGEWYKNRGMTWSYGQFDDAVLPACMYLMENAGLRPEERGDVVKVSRAISKMVNANDYDGGVIAGNWSGNYEGGKPPFYWNGSISILEQYLSTKGIVKYGQCWVFAGVVTTVCRALGIPCRPVTNMRSAHDYNMSLTIDQFLTEDGTDRISKRDVDDGKYPKVSDWGYGYGDKVWNFHVWNDVWMARKDLPDGYGGWQAIDATPQELSDNFKQCGPASHTAIKLGKTELNYDVNFLIGEVNADVITWKVDPKAKLGFTKVSSDKLDVGREIITKAPGDNAKGDQDKLIITDIYKAQEGTDANRLMLNSGASRSRTGRLAFEFPEPIDDVKFTIEDIERVPIGEDFSVTVTAKNESDSTRTVWMKICSASCYYTGVRANRIKWIDTTKTLEAGEEDSFTMHVSYKKEYFDKLVEFAMIDVFSVCHVKETSYNWYAQDSLQIKKPIIDVELPSTATVGQSMLVMLSFTNPLDRALTRCSVVVDGPGLTRPRTVQLRDIAAKGEMMHELKLYPKRGGRRTIIAVFNSIELVDLTGSNNVDVIEA